LRKKQEAYWISSTLKLKIAFFQLYLSLIGNYLGFYKPDINDEILTASNVFDFNAYLESLPEKNKPFMKDLSKTQQFILFIERSYFGLRNNNELSFFIHGIRKTRDDGIEKLNDDLKNIYNRLLFNYKNVFLKLRIIEKSQYYII